jgi:hypothetical protein
MRRRGAPRAPPAPASLSVITTDATVASTQLLLRGVSGRPQRTDRRESPHHYSSTPAWTEARQDGVK